jgi:hypothetical protein
VQKKVLAAKTSDVTCFTSLYPSNYQMFANLKQVRDFVDIHFQPDTNNIPPLNPNPPHTNTTSGSNSNTYTITTDPFKITKIEYPYGANVSQVYLFPQSLTIKGKKIEVITITGKKSRQD